MAKPNGYVIYRGPSQIDGSPIVLVATGFATKSDNEKTGAMIQTWIMREDIHPVEAVHTGKDYAICGDCKHRGYASEDGRNKARTCYVTVWQAPTAIWKAVERGSYTDVPLSEVSELFAGKPVRGGSYGDPAAVPSLIWAKIFANASGWTGYTHAWKKASPSYAKWFMASVETDRERADAKAKGYRTFRVRADTTDKVMNREMICPASKEAGFKTTCAKCKSCAGMSVSRRKDIVILDHGPKVRLTNARAATVAKRNGNATEKGVQ